MQAEERQAPDLLFRAKAKYTGLGKRAVVRLVCSEELRFMHGHSAAAGETAEQSWCWGWDTYWLCQLLVHSSLPLTKAAGHLCKLP